MDKINRKKRNNLIDIMRDAAVFSAETGRQYTVFLNDNGSIDLSRSFSYTTSYENVPYRLEIASFQIDPDDVNDYLRSVDEDSTIETLKSYGMSDEEIENYIQWFHDEYGDEEEVHLEALYYYYPELYDRIFEDTAYVLVDDWYNFDEMLDDLIKDLRAVDDEGNIIWSKLITQKWDNLIDAMETAADLADETEKTHFVYLKSDGKIIVTQDSTLKNDPNIIEILPT